MYYYGQPIHFFDADKIQWFLQVRRALDGEVFIDLSGKRHTLLSSDLVIADDAKICALAGIVWSLATAVNKQTTRIYVEIGNFDPVIIRQTWVRYGLRTDAELRFEKKINPAYTLSTVDYFFDLLIHYKLDLWWYTIIQQDYKSNTYSTHQIISFHIHQLTHFIFGDQSIPDDFLHHAETIIVWLGFDLDKRDDIRNCIAPSYRSIADISIPEDIFEEVARLYWYDRIVGLKQFWFIQHKPLIPEVLLQKKIETYMIDIFHFDQVETYPRLTDKMISTFDINSDTLYRLLNPVAPEKSYMRNTLLPSLYEVILKNFRSYDKIQICEIWKIRLQKEEKNCLWCMIYNVSSTDRSHDSFLLLKGIFQKLFSQLNVNDIKFLWSQASYWNLQKQAFIAQGNTIIWKIIQLHPLITIDDKIPQNAQIVYVECILDDLLFNGQTISFETLEHKSIKKELCFVMPYQTDISILTTTQIVGISHISLYDVYDLGNNYKSITLSYMLDPLYADKILQDIISEASTYHIVLKRDYVW
jgi:phenylalanyl-tRNA synthetase beta chain